MPSLERFEVVAPLPPCGEWRRVIAVDRGGIPRPVVLSFAPPSLIDDGARLAAVLRDAEAAGRLRHPGAVPVLGTETLDDALAVVEEYRAGAMLRELLDAGGRLPPDVAVRIALDACAALAAAHAIDAGGRRPLVHGAIDPSRILVGDGGEGLVFGFGTVGGGEAAADVRAVAAALHESLAGEPPGEPARPLGVPGIPRALADVVDRALGAGKGKPFAGAAAFAKALDGAGHVASHEAVASYADAILPTGEGARAALRGAIARAMRGAEIAEVSAELVVEPTDPSMAGGRGAVRPGESAPLLRPPSTRPGADPAGVFRAPASLPRRSRLPIVVGVCAAAGFALGLAGARLGLAGDPPPPEALEEPRAASVPPPPPAPAPAPAEEARPPPPVRAKVAPPASKPSRPRRPPAAGGTLAVTAPPDAEVFLDGRRIGRGSLRVEVAEGPHRIEVRRGTDRVEERFSVAPGETWTYEIAPAP